MAQTANIKSRINSINSISKITKAMELVSTAKLKKISKNVWKIKEYSIEVYNIFNDIINETEKSEYLVSGNFISKKVLWIIINSNIGLCGGYNLNVNKLVMNSISNNDDIYAIGAKAKSYFTNRKKNILFAEDVNINFSNEDAKRISLFIHDQFIAKKYDGIKIVYTKFINSINFEPKILDILPIIKKPTQKKDDKLKPLVDFDPSVEIILKESIILYLSTIIYGAIIESQVSEHTSRRIAMENATNNASDLNEKLTLEYNRKRQDGITQEITEIISGSDAQKK